MTINNIEEFLRDLERELEFLEENDTVDYYRSSDLSVREQFMDRSLQGLINKSNAMVLHLREVNNKQITNMTPIEILEQEIEDLKERVSDLENYRHKLSMIYNEIDCRIEHGANSNGYLEYVRSKMEEILIKESEATQDTF